MIDESKLYYRKAKIVRVVDGDTCHATIDNGFSEQREETLRFAGINCPEKKTGKPGADATAYTTSRLLGKEVLIRTYKKDSFGRWISRIWIDGVDFNQELLDKGFAVPFMVDSTEI